MPESIGQRLKQMREARYLTLEKASDDTRIRVIFLQALEADDYSVIPSAAVDPAYATCVCSAI
ncbi:MAG: helix-turn-helix domain-containing protein, partial [Anaerolineales bacterium]|nr:helix-turn-helix domain-containing protein [Anaerolineales bacterium]